MANTLQWVDWHLEYECPFRKERAVDQFIAAWRATWQLRAIDDCAARGDLYGDVCATSVCHFQDHSAPNGGFRISDAVEPAGDVFAARRTCGSCPANGLSPDFAGCCGMISFDPDDPHLDEAICFLIASLGMRERFERAFLVTKPRWYGLWVNSPLKLDQLDILRRIIPDAAIRRPDVKQFQNACARAIAHDIPLHVKLPPPGLTHLGMHATLPHCPRCRRVCGERCERREARRRHRCRACGLDYEVTETRWSEMEGADLELDQLERLLTPEEYRDVCDDWHRRHDEEAWAAEPAAHSAWRPSRLADAVRRVMGRS